MKRIALIMAGGTGSRMGGDVPKQFQLLNTKPVLIHTIEKFHPLSDEIILVLPEEWKSYWKELCDKYHCSIPHVMISGGQTRAESVKNGMSHVNTENIVAVHDAARPLVSLKLIEQLYNSAIINGNAIPVIPARDSMRMIDGDQNQSVDRSLYRLVQTPQCFNAGKLLSAFNQPDFSSYTDEASLMQAAGEKLFLVEGEPSNIKITTPDDLLFAAYYLGKNG